MSIQKPAISIVSSVDDDTVMVTLVHNKIELECVKADDSNMELFLRSIHEYWNLRTDLGIAVDNATNNARTFSLFRQVLPAEIRSEWDMIKSGLAGNDADYFCDGVDNLIERYIEPNGLQIQKRYLETYQLPVKNGKPIMKVSAFAYRLRFINKLLALFPGAPPLNPGDPIVPGGRVSYDEPALKAIMFNALPVELQDAYNGSGRDPFDPTIDMLRLARQLDIQSKAVTFKTLKTATNDSSNNANKGKGGRRGGKGKNKSGKSSGGGGSKDCHYHPGKHTWHQCFANPDGPNYKGTAVAAKIIAKAAGGTTDGSGGSGRRRNHSETNAVDSAGGKGTSTGAAKKARKNAETSSTGTGDAPETSANGETHWLDSLGAGGHI